MNKLHFRGKTGITETLFGDFLVKMSNFFEKKFNITVTVVWLVLVLIITIYDFIMLKKKKKEKKQVINKLCLDIFVLLSMIVFTIWDQIKLIKN